MIVKIDGSFAALVLLRYPVQKHERSGTAADDWVQKQWPRMTSHKTSEKMEAINNNFMAQLSWPAPPWSRYPQYGSLCRGCGCSCVAAVVKWAAATFNGSLLISSRKLYREWEVERSTSGSCVINLKSGQTADCAQWVTPLQVELQWRPPQWNSPSEIYFAASFQWRLEQRIYYIYYLLAVLQFLFVNHSFKYLAQFRT